MGMGHMEDGLELVRKNPAKAMFVGKRALTTVAKAENALGVIFPPTYRRFLTELGAGDIGGEEFYGITRTEFTDASVPNGVWLTLEERKTGLPEPLVVVYATGDGTWFAIDTSARDDTGEAPIVAWTPGLSKPDEPLEKVSPDFGEFFFTRIRDALGNPTLGPTV